MEPLDGTAHFSGLTFFVNFHLQGASIPKKKMILGPVVKEIGLNLLRKNTYKIEAPKVSIKNSNLSELRAVCTR